MKDFIAGCIVTLSVIATSVLVATGLVPWWAPLLALTCVLIGGAIVASACTPRFPW